VLAAHDTSDGAGDGDGLGRCRDFENFQCMDAGPVAP
jgi:hypothetical protein